MKRWFLYTGCMLLIILIIGLLIKNTQVKMLKESQTELTIETTEDINQYIYDDFDGYEEYYGTEK